MSLHTAEGNDNEIVGCGRAGKTKARSVVLITKAQMFLNMTLMNAHKMFANQ